MNLEGHDGVHLNIPDREDRGAGRGRHGGAICEPLTELSVFLPGNQLMERLWGME